MADMHPPEQRPTDSREAAFSAPSFEVLGKLLGIVCHELNNNLATLGETAGLAGDILNAGRMSDREKLSELARLFEALDDRIHRPAQLVRRLGDFSNLMLEPSPSDVNAAIEALLPLIEKRMAQCRISLKTSFAKNLPRIACAPTAIQLVVYAALNSMFSRFENACITIRTSVTGKTVSVELSADPAGQSLQEGDVDVLPVQSGLLIETRKGGAKTVIRVPIA